MIMERREFIALLGMASAMMPSAVAAESICTPDSPAAKLVGTWSFASSLNTRKDGTTFDRWGSNSKGILIFDRSGQYAQIIIGSESRVFGAKVFCAFGTYSVDSTNNVLITHVSNCSVAKLNDTVQNRNILTLTADELKYANPAASAGTSAEVIWKRMA
jgi:Lipocalin-like domain